MNTIINWANSGNLRDFPWRKEKRIWVVAVAEILLARTPAERVLPIYEKLLEKYPSPKCLSDGDARELANLLRTLGLQEKKAIQLKMLGALFSEEVSEEVLREKLKEVPGLGAYSYNAVLLFGMGIPKPIVDGNIGRLFQRYYGKKWKKKAVSSKEAWELAKELLPKEPEKAKIYSYGLLDFANEICKRKPKCERCPLAVYCKFFKLLKS